MGYTTDFSGQFKLNRTLSLEDKMFLTKFSQSRRMKRNLPREYGIDGEFYVAGSTDGDFGQTHEDNIIDYNTPPRTQPSLWCQWIPSEDGNYIQWDGGEKFYSYVEWIEYLIEKILSQRGYILNGEVEWQGEDHDDFGKIIVKNNVVKTKIGKRTYA